MDVECLICLKATFDLMPATLSIRASHSFEESLVARDIGNDHAQQIVDLAAHQVALEYFRPRCDRLFDDLDTLLRLHIEGDLDENGHTHSKGRRIEQRHVFANHSGLLELPDTAQAWRRRKPDAARKLPVGDSSVFLEFLEDVAIDLVQVDGMRRSCR